MVAKIKAALDARASADMLLIARTDAIAVEGFERALDRAEAYVEAGADVLFVEAPVTREQQGEIARRFGARVPVMANMVEGGKTPLLSAPELQLLGYKLVIFPGGTVRALAFALRDYLASLKTNGTTAPYRNRMLDFEALNGLLGTADFRERGQRYDAGDAA
jgi:2-methylisocitrate lyase-like PEP mutase family enzyme